MKELNTGDIIEVIGEVRTGSCKGCVFNNYFSGDCEICCAKGTILALRTGPKQGDTVWAKTHKNEEWTRCEFVCNDREVYVCMNTDTEELKFYHEVTTEDPYAIKYELTPQEALVAIGQGKKVRGHGFDEASHLEWSDVLGICMVDDKHGTEPINIPIAQMYAIIEEE